jgi:hypothetical protein
MAYLPDWERLSDALSRVVAAGLSRPEAQRDICRAIADRKIRIRLQAAKAEIPEARWSGRAVGSHVVIPKDLGPRDLDWRKSLPKRPWQHGDHPFVQVHLTLIELFTADVTLVLCAGSRAPDRSTKGKSRTRTQRSRGKRPLGHQEAHNASTSPRRNRTPSGQLRQMVRELRPQAQAPASVRKSPIPPNMPLDPPDFQKQARIWRANRIERFTARQRRVREWINFAEIAEWCSKEDGSIVPNEQKRAAAFDVLQTDLLAGEFEESGRSRVLFLLSTVTKSKMTRASLKDAIEYDYDGQHGRSYAAHCWIPRGLAEQWFERHRLPLPPWFARSARRFTPDTPATPQLPSHIADRKASPKESSRVSRERKRGRRPTKRARAMEAMRGDIRDGRQSASSLHAMLEKELAATYGVSRDTARKARSAVLSEFVENSNCDKTTNDK